MAIPKKLHYCWFGGKPKPEIFKVCHASWLRYAGDYELVEWNENSFDLQSAPFVRDAYAAKRWAFVSDYVRAWVLVQHGGIYVDTDCELRRPLDEFLEHRAFSGFEAARLPFTALWGSEPSHPWPRAVLSYYDQRRYHIDEPPNTLFVSDLLVSEFGIQPEHDRLQMGREGIAIYPSTHFCLDTPPNYAVHHFEGSWLKHAPSVRYKTAVTRAYHFSQLVHKGSLNDVTDLLDRIVKGGSLGLLLRAFCNLCLRKIGNETARLGRRLNRILRHKPRSNLSQH